MIQDLFRRIYINTDKKVINLSVLDPYKSVKIKNPGGPVIIKPAKIPKGLALDGFISESWELINLNKSLIQIKK